MVPKLGPICLRHRIPIMEAKTKESSKLQYYIVTFTRHNNGKQLCFSEHAGFIYKLNIIHEYSSIFIMKCA